MEETALTPTTPLLTPAVTPPAIAPQARPRRAPRPARPRAETTVSAAILTDRGLAEGYVALPLARLMASRVWASVETLNQALVLLEQHSFTRMTSDPAFEAQGKGLQQLLRAYAALTTQVADLTQRLAQNRLTTPDRLLLATGHLAVLLPDTPQEEALSPSPPAPPTASSTATEAIAAVRAATVSDATAVTVCPGPLSAPPPTSFAVESEVP